MLDKIDELCKQEGIYQYNDKLKLRFQIMDILSSHLASFKKGEVYILWPWNDAAYFLFELAQGKAELEDAQPNRGILKELIINKKLRRKYKCLLLPTYSEKRKRKFRAICLSCLNRCKVVDIYALLEKKGIIFQEDKNIGLGITYSDIILELKEYKDLVGQGSAESLVIKKLIGDYLSIRDFKNAFQYIDKLKDLNDAEYVKYCNIQEKIEILLSELKKNITEKGHIVVNWIDNLRFDELQIMDFVKKQSEKGICFENMYANGSYTSATMKTMFSGRTLIDDRIFMMPIEECKNEKLYKILQENGYDFLYLGSHFYKGIFRNATMKHIKGLYGDCREVPCAFLQYELIRLLANIEKKCFFIVHSLAETHPYYMNPIQEQAKPVKENVDILTCEEEEKNIIKNQMVMSQRYCDEQLKYYFKFYSDISYNIYMSDHGHLKDNEVIPFKGMHHVLFFVVGKNIFPKKYARVESLCLFPDFIELLIENKANEIEKIVENGYALIQQDDVYNFKNRKIHLNNPEMYRRYYIQYRGVVTANDLYVKNLLGEEYYAINNINENLINDAGYVERVCFLKQLAGNKYINIEKVSRYYEAKKVYDKLGYEIDKTVEFIEG